MWWRVIAGLLWMLPAVAQSYPPLTTDLGPEHPLFVFQVSSSPQADPTQYGQAVAQVWAGLPERLQPYSTLQIDLSGPTPEARFERYRVALAVLQQGDVPVVLRVANGAGLRDPLTLVENLLAEFACLRGVQAVGTSFNDYGPHPDNALPEDARWLADAADAVARYGRFLLVELEPLDWVRGMTAPWYRGLNERFRQCHGYVAPVVSMRGPQTIAGVSATLGLWLEGAAGNWGVKPTSRWYTDARCVRPGVFGITRDPGAMPTGLYRAMVLNGAMTGATVYSFEPGDDLWFGPQRRYWDEAILPTLTDLVDRALVARQDMVRTKVRVAVQLAQAATPLESHLNLRDVDGEFDEGRLIHGAYGMERPGQIYELIPNTGRHYWVPLLSAFAPPEALTGFARVVRPGEMATADAWRTLLDAEYTADGTGEATIVRVGRGLFILNNRENVYAPQTFRVAEAPSPVRGLEARRTTAGVALTWGFREGDVAYRVYRRVLPEAAFAIVAQDLHEAEWTDTAADPAASIAYAVTALTTEMEPYEGTVVYGDYKALSTVESRVVEEALVTPALGYGAGTPVALTNPTLSEAPPWWPSFEGAEEADRPVAESIVKRLDELDAGVVAQNLNAVLGLYTFDYEDKEGWRFQYVRRAWQWFLERYGVACRFSKQIRKWDFTDYQTKGTVRVLVYCRVSGVGLSDPSGRQADVGAWFPRNDSGEIWFTFTAQEGAWRIATTDPAFPNFRDILSFSAGPYEHFDPGPDIQ